MIEIFKTPTCSYCAQTIKYLKAKNAPHRVVDVTILPETNPDLLRYKEYAAKYGVSVPLVTDGKDGYVGWNLAKLNGMING